MILYDWRKIRSYSNDSLNEIIRIIDFITYKPLPNHYRDAEWRYSQIDWTGDSFLLNPVDLLRQRYGNKASIRDIAHYIWLASMRSYPEYKTTGELSDQYRIEAL